MMVHLLFSPSFTEHLLFKILESPLKLHKLVFCLLLGRGQRRCQVVILIALLVLNVGYQPLSFSQLHLERHHESALSL